jgi:hypothetical protein
VRERPDVLRLALESHRKLEGIDQRWYLDDCDPYSESAVMLGQEQMRDDPQLGAKELGRVWILPNGRFGKPEYSDHQWTGRKMNRMADIRQMAINKFRDWCPDDRLGVSWDALYISDSDVIPHPKTVKHLLSLDKPVVSEVYWSQWPRPDICVCGHPDIDHNQGGKRRCQHSTCPCTPIGFTPSRSPWLPNVWDVQNYGFSSAESIFRLREPGQYQVGGLGAITLIRRDAIERGASYLPIPGIVNYPGEDRHFSIRCAVHGIELWADTCYPAFHVYRPEEQLDEARAWFENGCNPEYFRSQWLTMGETHWMTTSWEKQIRSMCQ